MNTTPYIDTHAHLYDDVLSVQLSELMLRFEAIGGTQILMPNIDVQTLAPMRAVHEKYPTQTAMMIGLHPAYVDEDYQKKLDLLHREITTNNFIAIGEVGLDRIASSEFASAQRESFAQEIAWAKKTNLPLVLHARESVAQCVDMLRAEQDGSLRGVFHCFTGDISQARAVMDLGFYVGIGGVVTFKNARDLHEAVRAIPLQYILLETDAPYLAPVPYRGKTNESAYLPYVADVLARLKNISVETLCKATCENARTLFRL